VSPVRDRDNNFGALRLLFAVLVLAAHVPEMADGDNARELLTRVFGTLTFGDSAVDCFFLVSGYLITMSFVQSRSTLSYLKKRLARIVPAYLVCFWLCVLVLAPCVGGHLNAWVLERQVGWFLCLTQPIVPGAFFGLRSPWLDGPMWTIAYEFRCYLAVPLLAWLGAFRPGRRFWVLGAVAVLLVLNLVQHLRGIFPQPSSRNAVLWELVLGAPDQSLRFCAFFGVGMLFYLFRDAVRWTNTGALAAAVLLFGLLFNRILAETALAVFGAYLVFWAAFHVPVSRVSRLNNRWDISYGFYLYAWPVENLLLWRDRDMQLWPLGLLSLLGAGLLALASWSFIEKPALDWMHRSQARKAQNSD
jgi:peptidoglycan/LPS O-acetylase OafA/YrhL